MPRFLAETGRELEEVYDGRHGWAGIRRLAGVGPDVDDETADLSRRLGWLTHLDEPARMQTYQQGLAAARASRPLSLDATDGCAGPCSDFQLNHRGVLRAAEDTVSYLAARPAAAAELDELQTVLRERIALAGDVYPVPEWPLALHRHYARREIMAAVGFVAPGQRGRLSQGGILRLAAQRRELLFVTLDKSGKSFSPTTRYRDYAISRDRFHWETQAAASVTRPSGRRYVDPASDWTFYLFVRPDPGDPYAFLGPVRYLTHAGDRPIAITWRLAHPLPAALFDRYATLASG